MDRRPLQSEAAAFDFAHTLLERTREVDGLDLDQQSVGVVHDLAVV